MIPSLQDKCVNIDLGKGIKNIFILQDNDSKEIDTIVIEYGKKYYQLFFDESVLFFHEINMSIELFVEDMDKEIILQLINKNRLNINLNYKNNCLSILSISMSMVANIKNDSLNNIKLKA